MIHFEWLWAYALLALPLLFRWLLKPVQSARQTALRVPFLSDFERLHQGRGASSRRLLLAFAALAWLLFVIALSRPQWLGEYAQAPVSGRDLMLAVDVSGSMKEADFVIGGVRVSRIDAARIVGGDFIRRREGDRLGLIVFGGRPYLQMPLSFDTAAVARMLDETFIGLAEEKETAIGDAIGLALKRLRRRHSESGGHGESDERGGRGERGGSGESDESDESGGHDGRGERVLILLTDGANNAGRLSPQVAADLAAKENMKIYTIGIGADADMLGHFGTFFGRSRLDERTLKAIAERTGGRYFRARNTPELAEIYRVLDQLEVIERDPEVFRTRRALYPWPLAAALLVAAALLLLRSGWRGGWRGGRRSAA